MHRLDLPDGVRDGAVDDALVGCFALQPGQDLQSSIPSRSKSSGRITRRRDERSASAAAAGLVHAGDPREPLLTQGALVAVEVGPQRSQSRP